MIGAESFLDLLQSAPHWGFELTVEAFTGIVGFIVGRYFLRRHDRKFHPQALNETDVRNIVVDEVGAAARSAHRFQEG